MKHLSTLKLSKYTCSILTCLLEIGVVKTASDVKVEVCTVFEVQRGQTHRHKDRYFQTIYCNPPKGGGSITTNH